MNLDSAEQLFLCVVSQLDGFCEYCLKYNTFLKCLGKYFYQKISQWITWQNLQPTMSKQGDCFSGWRLTFSSSSVELPLVGRENLPRHVVHSTSVTCKGLFLAAKDYLFSCRECHIAYSKWKSYCLYPLAAWQARVPHNLGWEEEGSSRSLARKTEKNSQDSPASVGMLKECRVPLLWADACVSRRHQSHFLSSHCCASSCAWAQGKGKDQCLLPWLWQLGWQHLGSGWQDVSAQWGTWPVFYLDSELFSADPASYRVIWHSGQHFKTNE